MLLAKVLPYIKEDKWFSLVQPYIKEDNKWFIAFGGATVLTVLSFVVAFYFGWVVPTEINYIEVFAVFTGYACTILCNYQTRWNYPIGIACQIAVFILMFQAGSYGVAFFNLYLVFSLAYGFWYWKRSGVPTPVTNVKWDDSKIYLLFGVGVLALFYGVMYYFNPLVFNDQLVHIDALIAALSGVAQFLLDRKKIQTWDVWAIVNVISIPYLFYLGYYFLAFQYVFFLANTAIGYAAWNRTMSPNIA